jgi:hypothetical protein
MTATWSGLKIGAKSTISGPTPQTKTKTKQKLKTSLTAL